MIKVFDFFSGCGGTSLGFQNAGFEILGALDFDNNSACTYRNNFPFADFVEADIRKVSPKDLKNILTNREEYNLLFSGCAPCQPFSGQRKSTTLNDPRKNLLSEFGRFVDFWKPEYVFLENVPGLQNVNKSGRVLSAFRDILHKNRYEISSSIIDAGILGVPQHRKRFVLIAGLKNYRIESLKSMLESGRKKAPTVREFISDLPSLVAGESSNTIPNHIAAQLSSLNLERIQNTPEGGDRRNWPEFLRLNCHNGYKGHTDVYGRMKWDSPSSTLTTRCISYSNGRFGHPTENRAISVREAARLQTFPDSFVFHGKMNSCARQIGNAVPPLMSETIAQCFLDR